MALMTPAVRERLERAKSLAKSYREKSREGVENSLHVLESSGVATGLGYLETKRAASGQPAINVFGVQPELVIGMGAFVLSFTGAGKSYASHLRAISHGAMAVAAYKFGRDLGSGTSTLLSR